MYEYMHGCMDAWMHGCMYVYVYVSLSFCLHFHGPVNRIVEKHDFCYRVLWERACSMAGFAGKCCWQVCMCTPAFACDLSTRYLILQHAHNSRTDLRVSWHGLRARALAPRRRSPGFTRLPGRRLGKMVRAQPGSAGAQGQMRRRRAAQPAEVSTTMREAAFAVGMSPARPAGSSPSPSLKNQVRKDAGQAAARHQPGALRCSARDRLWGSRASYLSCSVLTIELTSKIAP